MSIELYLDSFNPLDPIFMNVVDDMKALAEQGFIDILQYDENGIPCVFVLTQAAFEFVEGDDFDTIEPEV